MMPSGFCETAVRTSPGHCVGSLLPSSVLHCQPIALQAALMPSTVKALDVLLSPLTTITTRLPFAAGRDVPSGSTEVPFLTLSSSDFASATPGGTSLEAEALDELLPLPLPALSSPHAASVNAAQIETTTA